MRYAIKKIPNDPETRAKVELALRPVVRITSRRGRGFRRGQRHYHQSLPLPLAAYYTAYCAEHGDFRTDTWGNKYVAGYDIQQATFRGFRNNKPVIRLERSDHVATAYKLGK